MAKITNLNELFYELLKDVYYAEKKIMKTLPKLAKAVGKDMELGRAFEKHCDETEGQIERLEKVFGLIDRSPSAKKCEAIEGILAEGEEIMKEVTDKATLQAGLLSGAQAVEHYEIARYGTLIAWANVLGEDKAAELLGETLEEEKQTDRILSELAESEINQAACDAMENEDKVLPRKRAAV